MTLLAVLSFAIPLFWCGYFSAAWSEMWIHAVLEGLAGLAALGLAVGGPGFLVWGATGALAWEIAFWLGGALVLTFSKPSVLVWPGFVAGGSLVVALAGLLEGSS